MSIRRASAIALAHEIIDGFGIEHPSEIDLETIAFSKNAIIKEKPLKGAQGRLIKKGSRGVISISSNIREPGQKRFCVAHEIGHLELHNRISQLAFCTSQMIQVYSSLPTEQEANIFASELLMPQGIFKELCPKAEPDYEVISHLTNTFQTSLTSTLYRYVELSHLVCALVVSKDGCIKWWKSAADFGFYIHNTGTRVSPYSGAGEAFAGKPIDDYAVDVQAKVWLSDKRVKDIWTIRELTFPLPYYNTVLSLIWPAPGSDLDTFD